jgi:uncharacterized RDD family membrane protein YckC
MTMTIGRYCQLCGEEKKRAEVVAEVHGIVVTAPCLMTRVFGEPMAASAEARAMVRFCAVCGAEQPAPLPERCPQCSSALSAQTRARDLAQAGSPAPLSARVIAFVLDLALILLLAYAAYRGLQQSGIELRTAEGGDIPGSEIFALCGIFIFIVYHTLFTALLGRTPGKLITGLKVVLVDGSSRIGLFRGLLRSALYLLTLYVLAIGVLLLIFQEPRAQWFKIIERDSLFHNPLTDTAVIKPH